MFELRRNIVDEMGKIAQSCKSEYEIALTREMSLKKSLTGAVAESRVAEHAKSVGNDRAWSFTGLYDYHSLEPLRMPSWRLLARRRDLREDQHRPLDLPYRAVDKQGKTVDPFQF